MQPRVAIIYLSYNGKKWIDEVFASIEKLNYPKDRIELIVVDNASEDGSQEYFRDHIVPKSQKELPKVTFFPNKENLGFAGGNNMGAEHALLDGVDYVFLLNNDAKFHPDAIKESVELAESDEQIGSVQSLMLLWQDKEVVNSTGGMVHFLGFGFVRDNGRKLSDITVKNGEEIAYASGAAVLYRAEVLKEVGLLDHHLFLYHEDLQLGWRIRLAGYKNVLAKNSIVYHFYEFKRSIQKFFWMERNRLLVHFTYLRLGTLLLLAPFLLALELALIGFGIVGGWIKEKGRVYLAFLKPSTWVYLVKTRRQVQGLRAVPDKEIIRLFTPKISHQETNNPIVNYIGNPILSLIWVGLKKLIIW